MGASPRLPLAARPAAALAVLSGLAYFAAFPGVDAWPLSFVALVPLMVALRGQTPRRGAWLGWAAGFTMTVTGFYWLLEMLQVFSGFGLPLCVLFMILLCAYQGGRVALAGWLAARIEQRGWPPGLGFSLAFVASELLFPLLFPWTYAATVHQVPLLLQTADVLGPPGPVLLLVGFNLALAELWVARLEARPPRWQRAASVAAGSAAAVAYGLVRMAQVDAATAAAPQATVGVVQANMSLVGKRRDRNEGLRRHLDGTARLRAQGPLDLVVWSETSVMQPLQEEQAELAIALQVGRHLKVPAVFGSVIVRPVQDERKYVLFNSAIATDAAGQVTGRYDKQFLLAFGEYLPFGELLPILYRWSPNSGRFTPGTTLEPLDVGGHTVAAFICYEDIIPGFVHSIVRRRAPELLVNITNDAWFGDTTEPWIHLALAKLRAIEHRRFLVRGTNSGVSAVVDPVGRVVAHTQTFREETLRAGFAWLQARTPYGWWGNLPWWLLSGTALLLAYRRAPGLAGRLPRRAAPSGAQAPDAPAVAAGAGADPDRDGAPAPAPGPAADPRPE